MIKKISVVLLSSFTILSLIKFPVSAHLFNKHTVINIQTPTLTEEQKELLKEQKEILKKKYLENWKEKSPVEKKRALQNYKKELDDFCKEQFGFSYHDLKMKYRHYFKKLPS